MIEKELILWITEAECEEVDLHEELQEVIRATFPVELSEVSFNSFTEFQEWSSNFLNSI